MVRYMVDAVLALIGEIPPIEGRPTFRTVWDRKNRLLSGLRKCKHVDHPRHGHQGILLGDKEWALRSTKPYDVPAVQPAILQLTPGAITDTAQRNEELAWRVRTDQRETYENINAALLQILERILEPAYHVGNHEAGETGFGDLTPKDVIARLQELYGQPSYQEIKDALARLTLPMDRTQPMEPMLKEIEETQMFLLAVPDEERQLSDVQLITYALIKLSDTGGMYTKAIER